jgi:hypothetical protein
MRTYVLTLAALAALTLLAAGAALAAETTPEDVFMVKDDAWVLKADGSEAPGPNGADLRVGVWWFAVTPGLQEEAQGLERGVLLYDLTEDRYSFLPTADEQERVENVSISPDKKRVVIACNESRFTTKLYVYDRETLKLEKSFTGYSDVWFVDDVRFAFTLIDESVERPEEAGLWGTSAAMYEPAADSGYVVMKQATATESFNVSSADEDGVIINVYSVKTEKDWEDIDKQESSEITIEVPAAG